MANAHAGAVRRSRAFHVDAHGIFDAAPDDGLTETAVASDLLRHRVNFHAKLARGLDNAPGVLLNRVEIDGVAIGGKFSLLVQSDRGLDQLRVSAAGELEKHVLSRLAIGIAGGQNHGGENDEATRDQLIGGLIAPQNEPIVHMLIRREPMSAPKTVPEPPLSLVPPTITAAMTVKRSASPRL